MTSPSLPQLVSQLIEKHQTKIQETKQKLLEIKKKFNPQNPGNVTLQNATQKNAQLTAWIEKAKKLCRDLTQKINSATTEMQQSPTG